MLKESLEKLSLKLEDKELNKIEILIELMSITQSDLFEHSEKEEFVEEICRIFWILSCKIELGAIRNERFSVKQFKNFIEYVENLSSTNEKKEIYTPPGIVLVRFLCDLSNKDRTLYDNLKDKFKIFYESIGKFTEQFSWIFRIKDESSKFVYPIHDLLDGVIEEAKSPTKDNLIQLFFALQIYNQINFDEVCSIHQKVIEIARRYNIRILELLCKEGSIIGGPLASRNNLLNQVIMVQNGETLVIRSSKSGYFGDEPVKAEINDQNEEIAWYIELKIQENWKFCSLKDILLGGNLNAKIDVLSDICKKSCYNVFYDDAFVINQNDGSYIQITNRFRDCQIVEFENKSCACLSKNFWKLIGNSQNGIRSVILKENKNESNVLTMDFLAAFYAELINESDCDNAIYLDAIQTLPKEKFYQNSLFELFIKEYEKQNKIEEAVIRYYDFIKKYVVPDGCSKEASMDLVPRLIMPYQLFIPCEGDIKIVLDRKKETDITGKIVPVELKKGKNKSRFYDILNQVYIDNFKLDNEDENIDDYEGGEYWAINNNNEYIVFSPKWRKLEKYLKKLSEISADYILEEKTLLNEPDFCKLVTVVQNTGFTDKLLKLYGMTSECECKALAVFKLLWHMQSFVDSGELKKWFDVFKDLILNKYYSEYVLNSAKWDVEFVNQIKNLENVETLFIGKESYGDGGTLSNIISKNISGDRSIIKWSIDETKLNANLKKDDNCGYYLSIEGCEHKTISKIVFLTDNIISGSSTEKMLNYYFSKLGESKKSFLKLDTKIDELIKTNKRILGKDVEIEIRCIFAFDDKDIPYGKSKLEARKAHYALNVRALHVIPFSKYKVNGDVGKMIKDLYGKEFDPQYSNHAYVLRAHNMPYDNMLPDCMLKIETMGGLLQRKNEL